MTNLEARATITPEGYNTPLGFKEILSPELLEQVCHTYVRQVDFNDRKVKGTLTRAKDERRRLYNIHLSTRYGLKEQVKTFVHEIVHIYLGPIFESGRASGVPSPNRGEEMEVEEGQAEQEMQRFYQKNWRTARRLFTEYTGITFPQPKTQNS